MKSKKISFLIAAHNEEKIIEKTLKNLANLRYDNYEVILGLDGCTDNTEKIVKKYCLKYKNFKYYGLNLREGKPTVIDAIIKKSAGEIIIINDADWLFTSKNPNGIKEMIKLFDDSKIGGIAESFPVEWEKSRIEKGSLGYKMVAYSSYFWLNFQKENFGNKKNKLIFLKEPTMSLCNIFRKELYKPDTSLGDDFERTKNIMNKGFKIVFFEDENMPRMIANYNHIGVKDLFRQKIRTAIARNQLKDEQKTNIKNYFFPSIKYISKESFKENLYIGFIVHLWIILTIIATIFSKFKKMGTKEGWKLRIKR